MSDMEHTIEQVRQAMQDAMNTYGPFSGTDQAQHVYDYLHASGLIAPTPLREEWAARYVNGGGAICRTRDEAEAELARMNRDSRRPRIDEPPAPEIAGIYARYVSDWRPVDRAEGDGRADQ